jgi:hypothetical protein
MKQGEDASQNVALDLKDARISLPFLGWEKGPGVPATAHFVMQKTDAGTRVTDLLLTGKGFGAKGTLTVGPNGMLRELDLENVALHAGDDLSLTATQKAGGYDVRLKGSALDARGIVRSIGEGMKGGKVDVFPIRIALDLAAVTGQNDVTLSDVSGTMVVTEKGLDAASLTGEAADGQPFEWSLGKEGGTRTLTVSADNGGSLIRFAGIYSKIAGGKLDLKYSGDVGGAGSGTVTLRDFRLLNQSALAPAVQLAHQYPETAAVRTAAATSGDMTFDQLKIPFRQKDWVISIEGAALRGSMMGATGAGTVNIPGGRIAVSGTFIPAFGINNIAGAIPLFGAILGGGRNEGLVGITYKMFGPISDPKITMNPISAIAPGIFRKIFEYN